MIAAKALSIIDGDTKHNLKAIIEAMTQAKEAGADYIFLGESVYQGFDGLTWSYESDKDIALGRHSPVMDFIRSECHNLNIGLGFGYIEYDTNLFSSYIIIDANGKDLCHYRRMSLGWKENMTDERYQEGHKLVDFNLGDTRATIAICGDLWTDSLIKAFKDHPSDLILWPLNIDYSDKAWAIDKDDYMAQMAKFNKGVVMINSRDKNARGGLIYYKKGFLSQVARNQDDLLLIDI